MKLSVDFAFEGFRIIRQKPQVILAWGVLSLLLNGLATYALIAMGGDTFRQLSQMTPGSAADPTAVLGLYGKVAPAYGVMMLLTLLFHALISCAVYRVVLGKGDSGFGALRFGGQELRQILVAILFFLIIIGLEFVCILAGAIAGSILSVVLGLISKPLAGAGLVVGILVGVGALIWMIMRLSLASVQSFDQKRINMFGSWKLTKGNSGTLFVGYVITLVMALLVAVLCLVVLGGTLVAVNGGTLSVLQRLSAIREGAMQDVVFLGYMAIMNLLITPLLVAISIGAPAAAYKELSGSGAKVDNLF